MKQQMMNPFAGFIRKNTQGKQTKSADSKSAYQKSGKEAINQEKQKAQQTNPKLE